jgi:hypothetical protein
MNLIELLERPALELFTSLPGTEKVDKKKEACFSFGHRLGLSKTGIV